MQRILSCRVIYAEPLLLPPGAFAPESPLYTYSYRLHVHLWSTAAAISLAALASAAVWLSMLLWLLTSSLFLLHLWSVLLLLPILSLQSPCHRRSSLAFCFVAVLFVSFVVLFDSIVDAVAVASVTALSLVLLVACCSCSGQFECRLCLTLHTNEGSYLSHTQGKKHQTNLSRRLAKEKADAVVAPMPLKVRWSDLAVAVVGASGLPAVAAGPCAAGRASELLLCGPL